MTEWTGEALAAQREVENLVARYAHRLDAHDWEGFTALLADGAELRHGMVGTCRGREEVRALLEAVSRTLLATQHLFGNVAVEVDDGARNVYAEWDVHAIHVFAGDPPRRSAGGAHYRGGFVHTGAGWRIQDLEITVTWEDPDLGALFAAAAGPASP